MTLESLAPAMAHASLFPMQPPAHIVEQAHLLAQAKEIGTVMFKSRLCPKGIESVEAAQYVCLYAQSLGIAPVRAFNLFFIVPGGTPQITTKGAAALIAMRGGQVEVVKLTDDECVLEGTHPSGRTLTVSVTKAQFKHLLSKSTWQQYPQDMLYAACFRRLAIRLFADLTQGLEPMDPREFDDTQGTNPPAKALAKSGGSALLAARTQAPNVQAMEKHEPPIAAAGEEFVNLKGPNGRAHGQIVGAVIDALALPADFRAAHAKGLQAYLELVPVPARADAVEDAVRAFLRTVDIVPGVDLDDPEPDLDGVE